MRDRQGRFALEQPSDPIDQITAAAERLEAMMETERQKAARLQSELEAERAERKRLDQQATDMRIALTQALQGLKAARGSNEVTVNRIHTAKRAVVEALKGAA